MRSNKSKRYFCAESGVTRRAASARFLASRAQAAPPPQRPTGAGGVGDSNVLWTDPLTGGSFTNGIYANGIVYVAGLDGVGDGTFARTDIQSGPGAASGIDLLPVLGRLVYVNGQVLAPINPVSQGNALIFAVDPITTLLNNYFVTIPTALSNQVTVGDVLVYVSTDGNLVGITPVPTTDQSGDPAYEIQTVFSLPLNEPPGVAAVDMLGDTIIVAADVAAWAARMVNGQPVIVWKTAAGYGGDSVTLSGNTAYIVDSSASPARIVALNIVDGTPAWTYNNKSNLGPCLNFNGNIFAGDAAGNLNVLDPNTGQPMAGSPLPLGGDVSGSNLFIEDGIAYTSASNGTVYAVDTTNLDSSGITTFNGAPGPGGSLAGVENGICFIISSPGNVSGVDMASLVHGFACESTLQPDTAAAGGSGYIPSTPVFHTVVSLVDPAKNPRVNIAVKVWASDTLTISDGVNSYNIGPTNIAWLETDSAGYLNITATPTSISCPTLYLWSSFMDRSETILIYPDHDVVNSVSTKAASVSSATNYAGQTILNSGASASDVVTVITNTMGAGSSLPVSNSLQRMAAHQQRRKRRGQLLSGVETTSSYFAFPNTTTNMGYANSPLQPSSANRPFLAGNAVGFTYPSNSSANDLGINAGAPGLLGLSWDDFKSKILHGANVIKRIVCTVDNSINQEVHTITDDAGNIYNLTVNYVEDAITVVAGLLKSVLKDLESAIEWLSTILDWNGIIQVQKMIASQITQNLTNIQSWVNLQASQTPKYGPVTSTFSTVQHGITNFVNQVNSAIGGASFSGIQNQYCGGNDPKKVFSLGGAKSYGPANHMFAKVKNNLSTSNGITAGVGGVRLTSLNTGPLEPMIQLFLNLAEGIKNDLASTWPQIETELTNFITNFSNAYKNPIKFLENGIIDILTLVGDLLNLLLSGIETVITSILDFLVGPQGLLSFLITFLTQAIPNIPVISDIWSLISEGQPLTVVNLVSLIVAVPTKIISEALSLNASGETVAGEPPLGGWVVIGAGVSSIFGGMVDAFCDGASIPANDMAAGLDIGCSVAGYFLDLPSDFAQNQAGTYVWWCLSLVPIGISLMNAATFAAGSVPTTDPAYDPLQAVWQKISPNILTAFGIIMFFTACGLGVTDPNTLWGPKGLSGPPTTLIGNMFEGADWFPKALSNGDQTCKTILAISDVIWPLGSSICNIVAAES